MNDFSEMENELRALRPVQPSARLLESVAHELDGSTETAAAPGHVIQPNRFGLGWLSLGLGLAAAAALLLLARVNQPSTTTPSQTVATGSPAITTPAARLTSSQFIPFGASRVVYHTQDEGLLFPRGSSGPVRRIRSRARESLQWHNPETGASLRVSYPSEEVQFIPVAGQ